MSKPPRPSLSGRSSAKSAATEPPAAAGTDDQAEAASAPAPADALRDFKTMMCRVNRAGWREMSRLAIDRDRTLEDLIIEACNALLVREGLSPVIEKRSPARR
jgi:hypothetical protein